MGRRPAQTSLPKYMRRRGHTFQIKYPIPDHARHEFPELTGQKAILTVSLGRDEKLALERFVSVRSEIEAKIRKADTQLEAVGGQKASVNKEERLHTRQEIEDAIKRWEQKRILNNKKLGEQRELRFLHDLDVSEFRAECNSSEMDRIMRIQEAADAIGSNRTGLDDPNLSKFDPTWFSKHGLFDSYSAVPNFNKRMVMALSEEGLIINESAPVLRRVFAVRSFSASLVRVMRSELYYLNGDKRYPVDDDEELNEADGFPKVVKKPFEAVKNGKLETDKLVLSELFERFVSTKERKNLPKKRAHWRLLIENVGDVSLASCVPEVFEELIINMRRAPLVRSKVYYGYSLKSLIELRDEISKSLGVVRTREEKTIFDYFCTYKSVFEYAKYMRFISDNPINKAVMPDKPKIKNSKRIKAYTDEDLRKIFNTPMYMGCSKVYSSNGKLYGYRNNEGSLIIRDGRYYMPILALYTGARMEEWGGARTQDIKEKDGIWYLDLTDRNVKTENSKRFVPLHPALINSEGIDFLSYLFKRQRKGDEYLFPEFRPNPNEENALMLEVQRMCADDDQPQEQDVEVLKMTAKYSKWFGLWQRENNLKQSRKNFHSFRHTFKDRLRQPNTNEDINNQITGHSNSNTGSLYGKDKETMLNKLPQLYEAICRVQYITFPVLPKG